MGIKLFEYNQTAYKAALNLMKQNGKAAVIHPTGTGKSFIGFKLCEDFPEASVCWLSPSEYIFKTQTENLKKASDGFIPQNIKFYTYAKLMNMSKADIEGIKPDFIILDEFHRCGAEMWGQGVNNLLGVFPEAMILGLSATAVRYLDNQRNMSEELFNGNIASEMTLGEAVVRGILHSPKYVLSVFSYQNNLNMYKRRIKGVKSKAARDEAEKLLESLRRALDKSDGLDKIFARHMIDKTGKYIVFCANAEHMREMISHSSEWFARVDSKPHIYSAYADDPETSRAFADFQKDESEHLKLLFCIDMLNEGIHIDGICGVILFRPTVSPIVYKQQIGRALSAGSTKTPVIFDIVNNIENLYSIDSVEQEMQAAVNYYHFLGLDKEIINEHFMISGELRDARILFERLNDTLTASWDMMYACARKYYESHGNLDVPRRFKTELGYALGNWIYTQRRIYRGEQFGKLDEIRIKKLESIGMHWESMRDLSWERYYAAAKRYYDEHGNLETKVHDLTDDGIDLGAWICRFRTYRKSDIRHSYLTAERIALLDKIGMIWDVPDYIWEENFSECMEYYRSHGNLNIPCSYCSPKGLKIGMWIRRQRTLRSGKGIGAKLTDDQIRRLDSIGMEWKDRSELAWEKGYAEAAAYFSRTGNLDVPASYLTSSGFKLGGWIAAERVRGKDALSAEKQRQLDEIGMIWRKPDSWEVRYALAKAYYDEHGNLNIPAKYKANGIWLSKWVNEQRQIYIGNRRNKTLTDEQIKRLEAIGMTWQNRNCSGRISAWEEQFREAFCFYSVNGHLNVPGDYITDNGKKLSLWILRQRKLRKQGLLTEEQIVRLDRIGMIWNPENSWETGFRHAEEYFKKYGSLEVSADFVCADGYALGNWLSNQRSKYNSAGRYHKLTEEQTARLDKIGMVWKPCEKAWLDGYEHAKEYMIILGGRKWSGSYISSDGYKTGQWIRAQERRWNNGKLEANRRQMLAGIGLVFEIKAGISDSSADLVADVGYGSVAI